MIAGAAPAAKRRRSTSRLRVERGLTSRHVTRIRIAAWPGSEILANLKYLRQWAHFSSTELALLGYKINSAQARIFRAPVPPAAVMRRRRVPGSTGGALEGSGTRWRHHYARLAVLTRAGIQPRKQIAATVGHICMQACMLRSVMVTRHIAANATPPSAQRSPQHTNHAAPGVTSGTSAACKRTMRRREFQGTHNLAYISAVGDVYNRCTI